MQLCADASNGGGGICRRLSLALLPGVSILESASLVSVVGRRGRSSGKRLRVRVQLRGQTSVSDRGSDFLPLSEVFYRTWTLMYMWGQNSDREYFFASEFFHTACRTSAGHSCGAKI